MTNVVIPIKALAKAKGRFRSVLSPNERAELVLAMLRDVLTALRRSDVNDIWLVASDDTVFDLGAEFGVQSLRETTPDGYNSAVSLGLSAVPKDCPVLVPPGDVPLVRPEGIAAFMEGSGELRIAADHLGKGTNGLFLASPNLIRPHFGWDSLQNHMDAGNRAALVTQKVVLLRLARDIDTPADVAHLARAPLKAASPGFLHSIRLFEGAARRIKTRILFRLAVFR